jgi:hypothetical protein
LDGIAIYFSLQTCLTGIAGEEMDGITDGETTGTTDGEIVGEAIVLASVLSMTHTYGTTKITMQACGTMVGITDGII